MKLKDRLRYTTTSTSSSNVTLEQVYVSMWKYDIIHVLIEVLREDFSLISGQWQTAAELTCLLAKTCSFIKPQRPSPKHNAHSSLSLDSFTNEELEEYYDILLPTAIDSFLIVANNIHEYENHNSNNAASSNNLEHFKAALSSLSRACSIHNQYISRVVQSPYLLHLLVTDNQLYAMQVLNLLYELVSLEKQVLPTEELQSLLDELVFKIGGTDKDLVMGSLSLLALFSSSNVVILDLICDKYKGLSLLLQKWSGLFDGPIKNFAQTLLERVKVSDDDYRQGKAAVIIQAGWKGYCIRKKMLKAKRGIIKFQRLYRKRKTRKTKEEIIAKGSHKILESTIHKLQSTREHHERQKQLLEQMSAASVEDYLSRQETVAVIKIQSWWRHLRDKKRSESATLFNTREKSAIVIQKAYKKHIKKKSASLSAPHSLLSPKYSLPPLSNTEKQYLEGEVSLLRIPQIDKSSSSSHEELRSQLDWFYTSREEARESDRRQAFLMTQVSVLPLL